MMAEMNAAMDQAEEDHSIRAIVVKANGNLFQQDLIWMMKFGHQTKMRTFVLLCKMTLIPSCVFGIHQTNHCLCSRILSRWSHGVGAELRSDLPQVVQCLESQVSIASGIVVLNLPWLTGPKLAKEILLCADKRIPAQRIY